jgi:predicted 3-demethylubiquinone-9 3-methyltransferase (glyoxalase superfamily)
MNKITSFLWFNDNAEEATDFYTSIFNNSKIESLVRYDKAGAEASGRSEGSVMVVDFELEGQTFGALNGGPAQPGFITDFTPAISFYVTCKTVAEAKELWDKLLPSAKVMMAFQKYPFSEGFGWLADKFGVSWQIFTGESNQGIAPCLMFTGKQAGKAQEAINFYTSVFLAQARFVESKVEMLAQYGEDQPEENGSIMHGEFTLGGQRFMAMDSHLQHDFGFTPAISFVVNCETQAEVDHFWDKLSEGGATNVCGWLTDKYGITWQVVPTILGKLLSGSDQERAKRVMTAMIKMTKLIVKDLEEA